MVDKTTRVCNHVVCGRVLQLIPLVTLKVVNGHWTLSAATPVSTTSDKASPIASPIGPSLMQNGVVFGLTKTHISSQRFSPKCPNSQFLVFNPSLPPAIVCDSSRCHDFSVSLPTPPHCLQLPVSVPSSYLAAERPTCVGL